MKLRNILAGAGVLAALAFATGASAMSPYNLGVLTAGTPLSQAVTDGAGAVDDIFNFTINPPPLTTHSHLVATFDPGQSGVFDFGSTVGLYDSSNVLLGSLTNILTAPGFVSVGGFNNIALNPGSYHIEVKGNVSDPNGINYTLGVFGAAVPEPATWAMLIGGLALMGASLRLSRRSAKGMTLA